MSQELPTVDKLQNTPDAQDWHESPDVGYRLGTDLSIQTVNRAWHDNIPADTAVPVPQGPITGVLAPPVRRFYERLYRRVINSQESESHAYLCHTPTEYRRYEMRCTPVADGLVATHTLMETRPHTMTPEDPDEARFRDAHGMVTMCVHCRRVKRPSVDDGWSWVPVWVRQAPRQTSHGLCIECETTYYPP